jgi:hypothetical protein
LGGCKSDRRIRQVCAGIMSGGGGGRQWTSNRGDRTGGDRPGEYAWRGEANEYERGSHRDKTRCLYISHQSIFNPRFASGSLTKTAANCEILSFLLPAIQETAEVRGQAACFVQVLTTRKPVAKGSVFHWWYNDANESRTFIGHSSPMKSRKARG